MSWIDKLEQRVGLRPDLDAATQASATAVDAIAELRLVVPDAFNDPALRAAAQAVIDQHARIVALKNEAGT